VVPETTFIAWLRKVAGISKAACYLAYYKSGGYAEKCGGLRGDFKEYPFRVLFVFKTAERRNNTAERLIQGNPPILTQVWLTTFSEATADPFGATPALKPYLYRGLFRCGECGCFITTETQKGHNYLRCTKRVSPCTQKYVREDEIAAQVDRIIGKVALEASIADAMLAEFKKERAQSANAEAAAIAATKAALTVCEKQIDLLLDLRLSEQVGEAEYVSKKHTLVNRKAELRGKMESFEANRLNRFEPAMRFGLEAKHAANLLAEGNHEKNRDFLKKVGSNFQVAEKSLALSFTNPWQFVADFNSTRASARADNEFSLTGVNWRRG